MEFDNQRRKAYVSENVYGVLISYSDSFLWGC